MIEYLKVINKNMKNNFYFSRLINRHQNLENKSEHKKEVFQRLGVIGLVAFITINLALLVVFNDPIFILWIACFSILIGFIVFWSLGELIGEQEKKYMAEIEDDFFSDLKNNHELIRDLSTLVINDDTEKAFNCIIDNVIQDNDDDTFYCFHNLLSHYNFVQSEEGTVNERSNFLQKLKIDVKRKREEENDQEYFQVKARERMLEML